MNPWDILGIGKTQDKNAVKQAYMSQLKDNNPETNPEGFLALRQAYEAVLEEIAKEAANNNPALQALFQKLEEIYNHVPSRMNPDLWDAALDCDVCKNLSPETKVELDIIIFALEHFDVPRSVWQVFNKHFRWTERQDELLEILQLPVIEALEHFINDHGDYLEYLEYNDPYVNVHRFIQLRDALAAAMDKKELAEAEAQFQAIAALGVDHPFLEVERAKYAALSGDGAQGEAILDAFLAKYEGVFGQIPYVLCAKGHILRESQDPAKQAQAIALFNQVIALHPDHLTAHVGIAETMIHAGDYEKAEKYLKEEVVPKFPTQGGLSSYFHEINTKRIEKHEASPHNNLSQEEIETLGKSYIYNNQIPKGMALLLQPNVVRTEKVCGLLGICYLDEGDYERAEDLVREAIEKEPRYAHYQTLVQIYFAQRMYEEALEASQTCLAEGVPDESLAVVQQASMIENKAFALQKTGQYEASLAAIDEGFALIPELGELYVSRAETYISMGRYQEALDDAQKAEALAPGWAYPLEIQADIFYRTKNINHMESVLAEAEELKSHKLDFYRACLKAENGDMKGYEQAIEDLLNEKLDGITHETILESRCFYYYDLDDWDQFLEAAQTLEAFFLDRQFRYPFYAYNYMVEAYRRLGDKDNVLSTIHKAMVSMPDHPEVVMDFGHFIEAESDASHESFALWEGISKQIPQHPSPYDRMARVLCQQGAHDKALDLINDALNILPGNGTLIGRRAFIRSELKDYVGAVEDFILGVTSPRSYWLPDQLYMEAATLLWTKLNDGAQAYHYFQLADGFGNLTPWELSCLADAHLYQGNAYEAALAVCDRALAEDPSDEYLHFTRGMVYKKMGDMTKAAENFEEAVRVVRDANEKYHDEHRIAGLALLELGRFEEAKAKFATAAELVKTDGTPDGICSCIHQSAALCHVYEGDYTAALACIDQAIATSNSVRNNQIRQEILQLLG